MDAKEAIGLPLIEIFRIINEDTRQTVDNPAAKVLRSGVVVGSPTTRCWLRVTAGKRRSTIAVRRSLTMAARLQARCWYFGISLIGGNPMGRCAGRRQSWRRSASEPCLASSRGNRPRSGPARRGNQHHCDALLRMLRAIPRTSSVCAPRPSGQVATRDELPTFLPGFVIFSRGAQSPACSRGLNEAIEEVVALKRNELRNVGVTLQMELSDDLPPALCDRVQLQQVIVNLITNAIQAMNGAGNTRNQLLIRTERIGMPRCRPLSATPGSASNRRKWTRCLERFTQPSRWHGNGVVDQPLDRREAQGSPVGDSERWSWTHHRAGSSMDLQHKLTALLAWRSVSPLARARPDRSTAWPPTDSRLGSEICKVFDVSGCQRRTSGDYDTAIWVSFLGQGFKIYLVETQRLTIAGCPIIQHHAPLPLP